MDASAEASARTSLSRAVLRAGVGEDWSSPALRRCWRTPATPRSKDNERLQQRCAPVPLPRRRATAPPDRGSVVDLCVEEALRKSSKATVDVVRSTRMASRSPTVRNPRSAKKQKLLEETVEHLVVMASGRCRQVESLGDPAHQQCIARRAAWLAANTGHHNSGSIGQKVR